jgi:hypothetical protein
VDEESDERLKGRVAPLWSFVPHPGLAGSDDGLGPVGDLQFGEDVRDVVTDGLGTQVEVGGNLRVAQSTGN